MPSTTFRVWSGSGVTQFVVNTAYAQGDRIVPALTDTGTNYTVARQFVWECTTAGTSDAALNPTWPASVTYNTTTVTSGTATFTARFIGYDASVVNWTFATPFLLYGLTAATSNFMYIYNYVAVHKTHQEELTVDTTYTSGAQQATIVCVDKDNNEAWVEMGTGGWVGNSTTNRSISFAAPVPFYHYGMTYRTAGSTADSITLSGGVDGVVNELENCYLWHGNTSTTSAIYLGGSGEFRGAVNLLNCTFRFGNASQSIQIGDAKVEIVGGRVASEGAQPNALFSFAEQGPDADVIGLDASCLKNTKYIAAEGTTGSHVLNLIDCVTPANLDVSINSFGDSGTVISAFNTGPHGVKSGFFKANGCGIVRSQTSVVASDGAKFDGTTKIGWMVVVGISDTRLTYNLPFRTPWISVYHDGTSTISPYLEILGLKITSVYDTTKLWAEWMYPAYVDSPLSVLVSSRSRSSSSNLPTGIGTANWSNWSVITPNVKSMRLSVPSPITPRSAGYIRVRVCCSLQEMEFVIDPQIRGLT